MTNAEFVREMLRLVEVRVAAVAAADPLRAGDDLAACMGAEAALEAAASRFLPQVPAAWARYRLGLGAGDSRVLWTLVAHELSPTTRARLRALGTESSSDISIDTLRRVAFGSTADAEAWRALGPTGALRRLALIEPVDATDSPEYRLTMKVSRRVLAMMHDDRQIDSDLAGLCDLRRERTAIDAVEVAPDIRAGVLSALAVGVPGLTLLVGRRGTGKRTLVLAAARSLGVPVLVIDARKLADTPTVVRRQVQLLLRDAALRGEVPLLLDVDALAARDERADRLSVLEGFDVPVVATSREPLQRRWNTPPAEICVDTPSQTQRQRLWRRALAEASEGDAELLASTYALSPALIISAGAVATKTAAGQEMRPAHVLRGIRAVLDDKLRGLAVRIESDQSWDDLVLPPEQQLRVDELVARVLRRDEVFNSWGFAAKVGGVTGIAALFSGPPGTGKTMCAGLVAQALHADLFQVDLSKIVSKWLGETEKNLGALFDAAEEGNGVLLFDEADALF